MFYVADRRQNSVLCYRILRCFALRLWVHRTAGSAWTSHIVATGASGYRAVFAALNGHAWGQGVRAWPTAGRGGLRGGPAYSAKANPYSDTLGNVFNPGSSYTQTLNSTHGRRLSADTWKTAGQSRTRLLGGVDGALGAPEVVRGPGNVFCLPETSARLQRPTTRPSPSGQSGLSDSAGRVP